MSMVIVEPTKAKIASTIGELVKILQAIPNQDASVYINDSEYGISDYITVEIDSYGDTILS